MIKSISYKQSEIIQNIVDLHCNGKIDVDLTYNNGSMYKGTNLEPQVKCDIDPKHNVVVSDATGTEFDDGQFRSIMFDPPFLATKGKSLNVNNENNLMAKRFTVFPDEMSLHTFYMKALVETYRILDNNGVLIFKCQDKVSSGKQYFSHCFVMNEAVRLGFYPLDLFVLLAKSRMVASWQRNQKHARKYHAYFWVFKKCSKRIKYI